MAVARVFSAQSAVLGGDVITIEADLSRGLHSFAVVGLAGKAVEEARDRVSAAIKNSGFPSPKSKNHKITISLAPADLRKEGPLFDLPIAVAYLIAAGEVTADLDGTLLLGELALDGTLRGVRGILSCVRAGARAGYHAAIVPAENAREAALIPDIAIIPARTLREVVAHIDPSHPEHAPIAHAPQTPIEPSWEEGDTDFEDIHGQEAAKRGLTIAAAGRHNVLMAGPPGTGKTMLARAFRSILPPLCAEEALDVTAIHSVAGTLRGAVLYTPPFRSPHHTASHVSLVGGGAHPRPGEVTLAHRGVLFLDELPEFERRSIDALRQPLEDRVVSISRVHGSMQFPADFILLAALNPHRGVGERAENGAREQGAHLRDALLETYKKKLSGPILDRIDLYLEVPHVAYETLAAERRGAGETARARAAILAARALQSARLSGRAARTNAEMSARDMDETITLSHEVTDLLRTAAGKLNLSPRSYHRVIKVSRTIADLAGAEHITPEHLLEALQYRVKF